MSCVIRCKWHVAVVTLLSKKNSSATGCFHWICLGVAGGPCLMALSLMEFFWLSKVWLQNVKGRWYRV
eukprot:13940917-Ditylum_brightwellii.AAC.1